MQRACVYMAVLAVLAGFFGKAWCEEPQAIDEAQMKAAVEAFSAGQEKQKAGDLKGAIEQWDHAIKLNPAYAGCMNHYSWFLAVDAPAELKDLDKALALALKAVELTKGHHKDIDDTLAEVYFQRKAYPEAVAWGKKALGEGLEGHSKKDYLEGQLAKFEKALKDSGAK